MSQAVAERRETAPMVSGEPVNMLALVARLAQDPTVDADKMERILMMQERLEVRQAKAAYTAAMVAMKAEGLPVIDRKGRIEVREKTASGKRDGDLTQSTAFAKWEDIDEAITPILTRHGFVLTFKTGTAPDGKVTVTGILSHEQGHSEETMITLPHDSSGSKNAVQAVGSTFSYGKRYTATALLNIRTKGEDDDGKRGGDPEPLTDEEITKIFDLIKRTGSDQEKFCKVMGVSIIAEIPRKDYGKALEKLHTKLDQQQREPKK